MMAQTTKISCNSLIDINKCVLFKKYACLCCRYSLECCYGWKTKHPSLLWTWSAQAGVELHKCCCRCQSGKGLSSLTGLWSNALGSQACKATEWQVTQQYQINRGIKTRHWPICVRFNLCTGKKKNTRPLFKIHKLTWKWQGLLCA